MLAEIDVDTNKVLDELSVIGDQIAVHNKQIKGNYSIINIFVLMVHIASVIVFLYLTVVI